MIKIDVLDVPITATLFIRRNADGVVVKAREPTDYYGSFIWEEGNYACDCNRALFFEWACGLERDDDYVQMCGTNDFAVRLIGPDGRELYCDGDWPAEAVPATSET